MSDPVVVGVDGSPAAVAAAETAAREALLRGVELRVVHVFTWPAMHVPAGSSPLGPPAGGVRESIERLLAEAVDRARAAAPEVRATGAVLPGEPVTALEGASRSAQLLVVGHRGSGGLRELLVGSTATHLAAHGHCPVMVVRDAAAPEGPTVVAVDGSPEGRGAVAFAFAEAALRGGELVALHAWSTWADHGESPGPGHPVELVDLIGDLDRLRAEEERLLAEALSGERARYPEVTVRLRVVRGRTRPTLIEASERAQLIVVGAKGHGGLADRLLGSVSQAVLHHARCPVTVVRAGL